MRKNVNSFWTDAKIDDLKSLWTSGDSASVIASQMGTTRNAVLGKVHRLGLEARVSSLHQVDVGERRSVFKSPEKKPRQARDKAPPKIINVVSPLTGIFISKMAPQRTRDHLLTKSELRAMLTQAVINTGGEL
jgi:GcrA cell cycle regulator